MIGEVFQFESAADAADHLARAVEPTAGFFHDDDTGTWTAVGWAEGRPKFEYRRAPDPERADEAARTFLRVIGGQP